MLKRIILCLNLIIITKSVHHTRNRDRINGHRWPQVSPHRRHFDNLQGLREDYDDSYWTPTEPSSTPPEDRSTEEEHYTKEVPGVFTQEEKNNGKNWLAMVLNKGPVLGLKSDCTGSECRESWIDEDPFFQYLNETMNEYKIGTFCLFVREFIDILNIKDWGSIDTIIDSIFVLVKMREDDGEYEKFGADVVERMDYYSELCVASQNYCMQILLYIHQILSSRGLLGGEKTWQGLTIADSFYLPLDKKFVFHVLKELYEYPRKKAVNGTEPLNGNEMVIIMEMAFVSPLHKGLLTETGKSFFDILNKLIKEHRKS